MALADQLRLMVLTDPALLKGRDAVDVCRRAVGGWGGGGEDGATMIQVRWKGGAAAEIAALARALVAALSVPVIVNDRIDVALAAGAAGAHLGWDDPPLETVRPHLPPEFILGLSVGSPEEAERARLTSADYWSIGPCFATGTKPDAGEPLGPHGFEHLARLAPEGVPVIGIGGITAGNAGLIARVGAAGVAVTAAVMGAPHPEAAARAIRHAMR